MMVSLTLGIHLIWGAYFIPCFMLIQETTPTTISELTTYMLKMAMYLQNKLAAFTFSFVGNWSFNAKACLQTCKTSSPLDTVFSSNSHRTVGSFSQNHTYS